MRKRSDVLVALRERLVTGVHFGRITNGDRLPSARRLAVELKADVRVVAAAYERLVGEGLVGRRSKSRGYYAQVERDAGGAPVPTSAWLIETVTDAVQRGIHVADLVTQLQKSVETARIRATCFECNDDQLSWLTFELERDYGFAAHAVDLSTFSTARDLPPEIAHSNVLVTTAAHATEVRPLALQLGKPLILVTLRMEILSEITPLLEEGNVYFICTDQRFADKLRKLYQGVPNGQNVRPMLLGVDDLSSIPDEAPVRVSRSAAERLAELPSRFQSRASVHAFSPETIRDIVAYLVRTNLAAAEAIESSVANAPG